MGRTQVVTGGVSTAEALPPREGERLGLPNLSPRERAQEEGLAGYREDLDGVTYIATATDYICTIFATRPQVVNGVVIEGRNRIARFSGSRFHVPRSDPDFEDVVKAMDRHASYGVYFTRAEVIAEQARVKKLEAARDQLRTLAADPQIAGQLREEMGESAFAKLKARAEEPVASN